MTKERFLKNLKWIVTCLIFYALPLLMICYGIGTRFDGQEEDAYERGFDRLQKVLSSLRNRENTARNFKELFEKMYFAAVAAPDPIAVFRKRIGFLKKRFPGILHFYVVGKDDQLIPEISEPRASRKILNILSQTTKEGVLKNNPKPFEAKWSILKNFIGPDGHSGELFANQGQCLEVNSREEKRWFYYTVGRGYGLFVHIDQPQNWDLIAIKDHLKRITLANRFPEITLGLNSLETPIPPGDVNKALQKFRDSFRPNHLIEGRLISVTNLESTALLWGSISTGNVINTQWKRFMTAAAATIIFLILALFSLSVMTGRKEFFFSIRLRLVILFFFASSLPLLVIFIVGWDYLHQKYQTSIRETFDGLERVLRTIDSNFPLMRRKMEISLNRRLGNSRFDTPPEQEKTLKLLRKLEKSMEISYLVVYDKNGEMPYQKGTQDSEKGTRGKKIMGGIVAKLAANLNNEPVPQKADFGTSFVESFGGISDPVALYARALNKLYNFSLGRNYAWIYMKPLRAEDGKVSHIINAHWDLKDVERSFIERQLSREAKIPKAIRVLATEPNMGWHVPDKFPFFDRLKSLILNIERQQTTINGKLFTGKKTFLLTGIKPKEFMRSYLVAIQPDDEIREELFVMECRLGIFAFISAIISVFLGINLSQKFLVPIGDLSQGVKAIQEKKFDHKVPKQENDEVGELAEMFNNMTENLHEVTMARLVQERLFPQEPLVLGEYKVNGKSRPATQLGGDYFEYMAIGSRYLMVLMGDVTGHGVPAAMVMAMSKAVVLNCANTETTALRIIETLNLIIFQSMKKKLLMTAGLLWIDTQTHEATSYNCGHPFPFKRNLEGKISMVEAGGSPLGTRAKISLKPNNFTLLPGERFYFYTDGLVESYEIDDGRAHFDHLMEYLESRPLLPVEQSCDDILDHHYHYTTGLPQPDDFTIVIVERSPAPTAQG